METVDGRSPGRERKVHKIKKQLFNRFVVIFGIDFSRLPLSSQTQMCSRPPHRHGWNLAIFPGGFVKGVSAL